MTKKKCIKLIMGTVGLPQPRGAEMVFLGLREIMHKKQKPQPLTQGGGFRKTGHSLLIIIARG